MNIQQALQRHDIILTEASIIESLRRSGQVTLHPYLENALLIYDTSGKEALRALYRRYLEIARNHDVPMIVSTPTWRANEERLSKSCITHNVNTDAVRFLEDIRATWGTWSSNIFIGGLVGCKNDAYTPEEGLSTNEARSFHSWQIDKLSEAGADLLLAATLPALPEATGIAMAMSKTRLPFIISFVINRHSTLLDGTSLELAVQSIDTACSRPPLGYMINCAYPSFLEAGSLSQSVLSRIIGYQANASSFDHCELDGAKTLRADPVSEWGDLMTELNKRYGIKILGGCCGTNHEHLEYIVRKINAMFRP